MRRKNMLAILYRAGYKYQLKQDYYIYIGINPEELIETQFLKLDSDGLFTIKSGYAWDGASGPAPDVDCVMRASLVHDALYQLIRDSYLDETPNKKIADQLFRDICIIDDMPKFITHLLYIGLRLFGKPFCDPSRKKLLTKSPKKGSMYIA